MSVNINIIKLINNFLLQNLRINFTFLNLVNKKNLFLRLKERKSLNRYDRFNINFYNKVQNGFLNLANKKKREYQIVNSNLDIKINEQLILNKIDKLIK